MAFNVRSGGDHAEMPVAQTVKSGDAVVIGDIAGIAELDATEREDGLYWTTVALEGVAYVAMAEAPDLGAAVYVGPDGTVGPVGLDAGDYALLGYVINDAPTGNEGYAVKLANGSKVTV